MEKIEFDKFIQILPGREKRNKEISVAFIISQNIKKSILYINKSIIEQLKFKSHEKRVCIFINSDNESEWLVCPSEGNRLDFKALLDTHHYRVSFKFNHDNNRNVPCFPVKKFEIIDNKLLIQVK